MLINQSKITDYLLVYLMIAFSGVPFFYKAHIAMMLAFMVFPFCVFVYRKRKIDRFLLYYLLVVLVVQVGQMVKFYEFPLQTYLGMYVRIFLGYFVIKSVGRKTVDYYVNILVFSVLTGSVFYLLTYVSPIESFLEDSVAPLFENPFIKKSEYRYWPTVILYTFNSQGEGLMWLKRNSGPFWEPGAFSGFLIVALLFNIIRTGKLVNHKNMLLMLGIVSTFSTSGLIVLVAVVIFYMVLNKDAIKRLILVPIIVSLGMMAFFSVGILGDKVIRKMNYTNKTYNTRFKSAELDIKDFLKNPLLGMGRNKETRFRGVTEARTIHRNNGITNHLAMYGGIIFLLYFYLTYLTFYRMCRVYEVDKRMAIFALITILLIGFSQVYFIKVFFIALTLMPVLYGKMEARKKVEENTNNP